MTRTTAALSLAAAFGFAATLGAQSPASTTTSPRMSDKHDITITGCLSKGADGNYMLTNAREDKASSTTTGTTGTTTTGTTTSGATTAGAMDHAMTWKLEGGSDLDRHVGHKIQVTGRTDWKDNDHSRSDNNPDTTAAIPPTTTNPPTTTGTSGTLTEPQRRPATTTDAQQPKLDVTSVKMIASSCS